MSKLTTIYSTDQLTLNGPLVTDLLIVHLGDPGPTLEAGDHAIEYGTAEYIGSGAFTVTRHGRKASRIVQP